MSLPYLIMGADLRKEEEYSFFGEIKRDGT
jgi:hypothetical protein